MSKNKPSIDKSFVSDYDVFLANFDMTHAQSTSQLIEIEKHLRIAYLRDNVVDKQEIVEVWKEF